MIINMFQSGNTRLCMVPYSQFYTLQKAGLHKDMPKSASRSHQSSTELSTLHPSSSSTSPRSHQSSTQLSTLHHSSSSTFSCISFSTSSSTSPTSHQSSTSSSLPPSIPLQPVSQPTAFSDLQHPMVSYCIM